MNFSYVKDEVLYPNEKIVKVVTKDIEFLEGEAAKNERSRIRFCAHRAVEDLIHEMFIVHARGNYIQPHRHINKHASFFIIKGEADAVIFEEGGEIEDIIHLGDIGSGRCLYFRLADSEYYTLLVKTSSLAFLETINGPWDPMHTQWAPWAPPENNKAEGTRYMADLRRKINQEFVS